MRPPFLEAVHQARIHGHPFAIATVVKVEGSSAARTGSKAVFDHEGRNLFGWVGGSCAERFIGENAVQSLKERASRIVLADLDDEIFGLGIACGGKMEVFIEPIFPDETVRLPNLGEFQNQAEALAQNFGFKLETTADSTNITDYGGLLLKFAQAIAATRGRDFRSLRDVKDLPATFVERKTITEKKIFILGRSRITENLALHFARLRWDVQVAAPSLREQDYPSTVKCQCVLESYDEIQFPRGGAVVIASHHARDPQFVEQALNEGAGYVGMIGSRKRALEVLDCMQWRGKMNIESPLYVPAGLDLDARGPEEIALSVAAEILK